MSVPADVRASDAEREGAALRLRDACVEGRLSVEDLARRLELAYSAETRGELEALTRDLPAPPLPVARARRHRPPRLPGERPFSERIGASKAPDRVLDDVVGIVAPRLAACGYELASRDERSVAFERDRRPLWTIVVAVGVFPVGLVALLHRTRSRIVFAAADADGGSAVTVFGTASLRLRRGFAELRE